MAETAAIEIVFEKEISMDRVVVLAPEKIKAYLNYCGTLFLRLLSNVLNIFPIRKNRIVFYSFNGKSCSCNPYYISKYLSEAYGDKLDMIWSFKEPDRFVDAVPVNCRRVKFRSLKHYYYLKTAQIVVYNVQEQGEVGRRKKQTFVQTWHASNGYKKISHAKDPLDQKRLALMHKNYSIVLSGCESMTQRRVRTSMGFEGEIIHGTPRMDALVNQDQPEIRQKVLQHYGLADDTKLLLYAPTWKKDRTDSNYGFDTERIKAAVEAKFGGTWIILVRFHPNMQVADDLENEYVKNATNYSDIQELIYAADLMITDYSSCIWDFSFLERPGFLFCTDFEENTGNDRFEIPIQEWGFPVCETMDALIDAIVSYDEEENKARIKENHITMGSFEDGHATERICSRIMEELALEG